jgi:hypothetical protein
MSPARIAICALIGVGIFLGIAGILSVGLPHPLFRGLLMFGLFVSAGVFILRTVLIGFRNGVMFAKGSRYGRITNPFGFWFYVSLASLLGVLSCAFGTYCLVNFAKLFHAGLYA